MCFAYYHLLIFSIHIFFLKINVLFKNELNYSKKDDIESFIVIYVHKV